jgi:WD40 repeat protein
MKAVASLAGLTNSVYSVAFSPDAQHIVSGNGDNLVKVWSVSARKEVASLAGHRHDVYVRSVAFNPDGQHIVSGSRDTLVNLWSVFGEKRVASLARHMNYVYSVASSPDGQHIVSGSSDHLLKLRRLCRRGRRLRRWLDTMIGFVRSPSVPTRNISFLGFERVGKGVVWQEGRLRRWLDTRIMFIRSPSVLMGNILFREVGTTW